MIAEILTYKKIVSEIDDLMNKSPYKKSYIIEQCGLPEASFYRKLKTLAFTADEMLSIAKVISPEEHFMMELQADIEQGKIDFKDGKYISHEEMVKRIKGRVKNK
ncbi:hypothetical protein [Flavobacterium foetidum]|uniref:hypothetical protein n=1 Tax=Flavobacterium foetidum TaxID=2026681 RepID=UPI001074C06D|nr:hypothetical protein [Flavobacterium foetidum]KAF2513836.1 hypothetical protein E0W73_13495 [Flavobacterium foetidum]